MDRDICNDLLGRFRGARTEKTSDLLAEQAADELAALYLQHLRELFKLLEAALPHWEALAAVQQARTELSEFEGPWSPTALDGGEPRARLLARHPCTPASHRVHEQGLAP